MITPLNPIPELHVCEVRDRGLANTERFIIRINESVNIGEFILTLGIRTAPQQAILIRDNLLWFGNLTLNPGDGILVFTGPGEPREFAVKGTTNKGYVVHWGKHQTIFANHGLVPVLFRLSSIQMPDSTTDVPQYPALPG